MGCRAGHGRARQDVPDGAVQDGYKVSKASMLTTRRIDELTWDARLLPVLALLFLLSFLDRTNVGNAKILGLKPDLKIDDAQYTHGLAVYYATYIAR